MSEPQKSLCIFLAARLLACSGAVAVILGAVGCVRRTLTIETEPQGALVYLNDMEVGVSPVSTDFVWYGDYDVTVRKEGCQTLHTHWDVKPPWYQIPPIDFFADVLYPGRIHDQRRLELELEPWSEPDQDELVGRALEMRERTFLEDE
jgi:hypothetical protein